MVLAFWVKLNNNKNNHVKKEHREQDTDLPLSGKQQWLSVISLLRCSRKCRRGLIKGTCAAVLQSEVSGGPVRAGELFYHLCSEAKKQTLPTPQWSDCWQWWSCSAAVEWCLTVNHNFSPISLLIWALIWGGHISCLFSLAWITQTFTLQLQHKPRTPRSWH